jgi:hypothetical protein
MKVTVPLEDEEAVALADYLRASKIPFCHVANESRGNTRAAMIRGAKLKKMGQMRGVWDYEIFIPAKGITGRVDAYQEIRIELKRQKGGTVSPEQKAWGKVYEKAGIPCRICKGCEEAIKFINEIKEEMGGICIDF